MFSSYFPRNSIFAESTLKQFAVREGVFYLQEFKLKGFFLSDLQIEVFTEGRLMLLLGCPENNLAYIFLCEHHFLKVFIFLVY